MERQRYRQSDGLYRTYKQTFGNKNHTFNWFGIWWDKNTIVFLKGKVISWFLITYLHQFFKIAGTLAHTSTVWSIRHLFQHIKIKVSVPLKLCHNFINKKYFLNINNAIRKAFLNKCKCGGNKRHFLKKKYISVREIALKYGYYNKIVKIWLVMVKYETENNDVPLTF